MKTYSTCGLLWVVAPTYRMAEYENGRVVESDQTAGLKLLQMGFGRKMENGVALHWLEAAYLVERKLLEVKDGGKTLTWQELIAEPAADTEKKKTTKISKKISSKKKKTPALSSSLPLAPPRSDQFLIYRQLRASGRLVRFSSGSPLQWRVYEKGIGREQERPQMMLSIVPPGWSVSIDSLEKQLAVSRLLRLDLGMAFVRDGRPVMMKVSKPPI